MHSLRRLFVGEDAYWPRLLPTLPSMETWSSGANGRLLVVDFETRGRWRRPSGIPESRDGHGISKEMLVSEMEEAGFVLVDDMKWANGDYALVFQVAVID